ncbi:hypothetical protein AMAG_12076 [Allomyces macrogynus ATCC 38327]|uniref:Aspartic peptidase DDI1-type domain-containing protein n=1 Tax=Allomyces macrogynus (strain ATCC 38327) TaxID=578462 RepID=A0A0L0SYN7_ALLM3|nr:hypothetical protein AMAG_12076 [Allomyces macrogynus ATCC 38327]|eukprot:KNE67622.1 hypothetical protein AMAG_12076 [Allomyces macrogynus ATCC 38327]
MPAGRNKNHAKAQTHKLFTLVPIHYVHGQVNMVPVTMFVDLGAQVTVKSRRFSEQCRLDHLVDPNYAIMAMGVGTARIIGRILSAKLQLGDRLVLDHSFSVMDNTPPSTDAPLNTQEHGLMDMIFGLDRLTRHDACSDLKTRALHINDTSILFLQQDELPKSMRGTDTLVASSSQTASPASALASTPFPLLAPATVLPLPTTVSLSGQLPTRAASEELPPESVIQALIELGATRKCDSVPEGCTR